MNPNLELVICEELRAHSTNKQTKKNHIKKKPLKTKPIRNKKQQQKKYPKPNTKQNQANTLHYLIEKTQSSGFSFPTDRLVSAKGNFRIQLGSPPSLEDTGGVL